jgi:hypothetical protein
MKVAIYAKSPKANSEEKSIDEQIQVCLKYIEENKLNCEEKHIYVDGEISGPSCDRPGFQELSTSIVNRQIQGIVVSDLSKMPIPILQLISWINHYDYYYKIEIFSTKGEKLYTDFERFLMSKDFSFKPMSNLRATHSFVILNKKRKRPVD